MVLKIRQAGELVLRQPTRLLSQQEILTRPIQDLVEAMRETMRDAPGVGLAAPQVGFPLQVVVIEDPPEYIQKLTAEQAAERGRRPVPFHVLINPVLKVVRSRTAQFFEGCLSVSGYTAIVPRADRVHVEALNEKGTPVTINATGWYARILQHEIDHLKGVLYTDRMQPRSFMTQDNFTRIWKDKSVKDAKSSLA